MVRPTKAFFTVLGEMNLRYFKKKPCKNTCIFARVGVFFCFCVFCEFVSVRAGFRGGVCSDGGGNRCLLTPRRPSSDETAVSPHAPATHPLNDQSIKIKRALRNENEARSVPRRRTAGSCCSLTNQTQTHTVRP